MKTLLNGIIKENSIFVLALGLCSSLAVTTTLEKSYMMGICVLFVLIFSNWEIYVSKTQMCYGLLVAWYIADLFPDLTLGVVSAGSGLAVKRKRIGNTDITFGDVANKAGAVNNADLLQGLKSNAFGVKAYTMIKTSGKINLFFQY